jgi:tetratricopeptide (TPR) repeat protein
VNRLALMLVLQVMAELAGAQDLSVAYVQGKANLRSGSQWVELAIGDPVSVDSTIAVGAAGLVEIKGAGVDLILTRPGTYCVRDILATRRQVSGPGFAAAVAKSMRFLFFGSTTRQQAILGVRGANEGASDEGGWTESGADVFLDAAKEYLKAGEYDKALAQLKEALSSATDEEVAEVRYYLACAFSLNGDVVEAWKQVVRLDPSTSVPWYGDFVLLKAKLLEDTNDYSGTIALLTGQEGRLSGNAQRAPLFHFLLGLAYGAQGDSPNAEQNLGMVMRLAPKSELAKAADQALRGL